MGLSGAAITLIKAFVRGEIKALKPNRPRALAVRALLTLGVTFCNVIALRHLPFFIFYILAFVTRSSLPALRLFFCMNTSTGKKRSPSSRDSPESLSPSIPAPENGSGDWIGYVIMGVAVLIGATECRMAATVEPDGNR